jgi:hypothetical protein
MMGVSTVSSSLQRGRICLNWLLSSSYMVLQWYELQSSNIFLLKSSRSFIYWACTQQKCTSQIKLFFSLYWYVWCCTLLEITSLSLTTKHSYPTRLGDEMTV